MSAFFRGALFLWLPFFFCLKMPQSNRTVENERSPINHASPQSMLGAQQIALDNSVVHLPAPCSMTVTRTTARLRRSLKAPETPPSPTTGGVALLQLEKCRAQGWVLFIHQRESLPFPYLLFCLSLFSPLLVLLLCTDCQC